MLGFASHRLGFVIYKARQRQQLTVNNKILSVTRNTYRYRRSFTLKDAIYCRKTTVERWVRVGKRSFESTARSRWGKNWNYSPKKISEQDFSLNETCVSGCKKDSIILTKGFFFVGIVSVMCQKLKITTPVCQWQKRALLTNVAMTVAVAPKEYM